MYSIAIIPLWLIGFLFFLLLAGVGLYLLSSRYKTSPFAPGLVPFAAHHIDEPVEAVEQNDVPSDELPRQERIAAHTVVVEESDNQNEVVFKTNFLLHKHKALGRRLQRIHGVAFSQGEGDCPPEFDDTTAQTFVIKKLTHFQWREILGKARKIVGEYFNGDIQISGYAGEEHPANNIDP